MDARANNRSISFSTPTMERADLCAVISRLQLSKGTFSSDFVLSFVSAPH